MGDIDNAGKQPEPMLALLLTRAEYSFVVQVVRSSQIPFAAHQMAAAVDAKFRSAMPVEQQQVRPDEPTEPAEQPAEESAEG